MIDGPAAQYFPNVSRETQDKLAEFAKLLRKWTGKINLVSPGTLPDLWQRHFQDSAQLFALVPQFSRWADLGSGGGFPGAVIAILAQEKMPGSKVILVESDQRKAAFLRTVSRETGSGFEVVAERIEATPPLSADVVSARALAPLSELLGLSARHLAPGGMALFLKGAKALSEVEEARKTWSFQLETIPSKTDPEAVILKIGDIERV